MRSAYDSRCKQTTGEALSEGEIGRQEIKMLSIARFIWQKTTDTVCAWLSVIKTKYTYVMKHFNASKPW